MAAQSQFRCHAQILSERHKRKTRGAEKEELTVSHPLSGYTATELSAAHIQRKRTESHA